MSLRPLTLVVALVLVISACGDDAGSTTEPTTPTTTATTIAATSSTAPATTTTTTAVPSTTTTTAAPTTTLPADAHPFYGISWASIFPDPGARALYRVEDFGLAGDFEAKVEYGVEFGGGVYDRWVFGDAEAGSTGIAIYFDFSEPWVVKYAGLEIYTTGSAAGPDTSEVYVEPAVFDISGAPGETVRAESTVQARFGSTAFDSEIVADLTMLADSGPITVAAGTFEDVIAFDLVLSGPFMGGDFPITCYLTADNLLLKVEMMGATYELLEAWG